MSSGIQLTFLKGVLRTCRKSFYLTGLFSFFINLLILTSAIYTLQLYDRVLASRSFETLIYLTVITLIALLVMALLDMARARILVHVSAWLDRALSPLALEKAPDEILQGSEYGGQVMRDIANFRSFFSGSSIFSLFDSPWVPVYLACIFFIHPLLGILATLGAILFFLLALMNELTTRSLLADANNQSLSAQNDVDASLRNAEVIQAMGMMSNLIEHWKTKNSKILQLQTMASNRGGIILSISKFLRLSLQILLLGFGAYLVIENEITGGAMIAASILLSRALAPVEQAIGVWKQLLSVRQSYKRLSAYYEKQSRATTEITLPKPQGAVQLNNVFYYIPKQRKPILQEITLEIAPGEMIAFIGPSGAGKSTLARLIVGALKPNSGEVRLEGADVYSWDRQAFGQYIGYLPQDIELFLGTVKDNIARMGEVDDEAVIEAAKLAGVHEIILSLPEGYDSRIGTNFSLSGGQRQRIALARAVYKQPCLLVLDEPNSNLDSEGEEALLNALLAMRKLKTTQIIISHKPSIVKYVDRILVLNKGKIQLLGQRDHIMGILQDMAKKQTPSNLRK